MRKIICLLLFVVLLPSVVKAYGGGAVAAAGAIAASNASRRIHQRQAEEHSKEVVQADGVVVCESHEGSTCEVSTGGCDYKMVSFDEFLYIQKGSRYSRVGISYNDYDNKMKIYYVREP